MKRPVQEPSLLYIKNMVCPRCITAVEDILSDLGIRVKSVRLGEAIVEGGLSIEQKEMLNTRLKALGFELLEPGKSALIAQIKSLVVQQIHYANEPLKVNFSTFLCENLHHEYSYLSRLFSSIEGITIEKFVTRQKIEKVKELLFYDELTLSEIAYQLNYSSVAHLSSQFKKETGMTPTVFKTSRLPKRKSLDNV